MGRKDIRNIGILAAVTLLIYCPVFYSRYFYTDEILHLWSYRQDPSFHMFVVQGRLLNDLLFRALFRSIDTIGQISYLRIFSLLGWIACLPAWYIIFARVTQKEGLSSYLPFLGVLFLVTCPPFTISVGWASILELFIANTAGLMAGYLFYMYRNPIATAVAILLGIASLFTYQNGFGCFLIPFLLHFLGRRRPSRLLYRGLLLYLTCFAIYFVLFKWQMQYLGVGASDRTGLNPDPFRKLAFFVARPLQTAFHFTWLPGQNLPGQNDAAGIIVYGILLLAFIWLNRTSGILYLCYYFALLVMAYLPSMAVRENYASNRTLLALDICVFFGFLASLRRTGLWKRQALPAAWVLGMLMTANAFYNFRYVFLAPVENEYRLVRKFTDNHYRKGMATIYFIRPGEDLFHRRYGVSRSMDEFGQPSTAPSWVPEPFIRQVILENTGDISLAKTLIVRDTTEGPLGSPSKDTLVVDVPKILDK